MKYDIDNPRIVDSPELSHYPCDACDDQPGKTRMWIYGPYVRVAVNFIKLMPSRKKAVEYIDNAPSLITEEWVKKEGFRFMHTEH
jgi:hypothetical protein